MVGYYKTWIFTCVWDVTVSLPDYEMGSHGNQGSKGRYSEKEQIFGYMIIILLTKKVSKCNFYYT